jgi:hypothetical protein
MSTHTLPRYSLIHLPLSSDGQLDGDETGGGIGDSEFPIGLSDVVVWREAEDEFRMRCASLVAVGEKGVQREEGAG